MTSPQPVMELRQWTSVLADPFNIQAGTPTLWTMTLPLSNCQDLSLTPKISSKVLILRMY